MSIDQMHIVYQLVSLTSHYNILITTPTISINARFFTTSADQLLTVLRQLFSTVLLLEIKPPQQTPIDQCTEQAIRN